MNKQIKQINKFKFFDKEIKYLFARNKGFSSRFQDSTIISKINLESFDENFKNKIKLICPNKVNQFGRLLIVSSRRAGNAVSRNLIRRRIKQIFIEENLFDLVAVSIIFPSSKLINLEYSSLKSELIKHFDLAKKYFTT